MECQSNKISRIEIIYYDDLLFFYIFSCRVEFMSKFYEGLGYPFQPFYFKSILDAEDDEE